MRRILPTIIATLTRHSRDIVVPGVDFAWEGNWTHKAFRLYEFVFGRRNSIRWEGGSYLHNGRVYRSFGTWENLISFVEHVIRSFRPVPGFKVVRVPNFALPGGGSMTSPFRFAIAFVTATPGTGTSSTISVTVSGSNTYMFAAPDFSSNTSAVAATYNSVAMTASAPVTWVGANAINGLYLASPSAGTNNVVGGTNWAAGTPGVVNVYSGCAQTAPDTYGTQTSAGTTVTLTLNTATANCWVVVLSTGSNNTPSASTGLTARSLNASGASIPSSFDSNGTVATGSQSYSVTGFSAQACVGVGYKFAAVAGGGGTVHSLMTLGVGS